MTDSMASELETQISRKRVFEEVDSVDDAERPCSASADLVADTQRGDTDMTPPPEYSAVKKRKGGEESLPTPPVGGDQPLEQDAKGRSVSAEPGNDDNSGVLALGQSRPSAGNSTFSIIIPSALTSTSAVPSPAKKPKLKLTPQEKAQKDAEIAAEKAKRAAEKAAKDAEKSKRDAEKARKDAEKAAEKAAKDAEKARKDAEKAVKDAEKAKKDAEKAAEKKQREEAKQKKEEVKQKAERAQMKLGNFFMSSTTPKDESKGNKALLSNKLRASLSPAPSAASNADTPLASTPSKPKISPYDALFPEFFIHKDVTVAPFTRFTFDEKATEVISNKIDGYLSGETCAVDLASFDARQLFHVALSVERGRKFMPVREIMDELTGNSRRPIDLTTESQHSQLKRTKDLLAKVPVKYLKFQEDVRPPYIGTYTSRPHHGIQSMARNPFHKDLPDQNYEYDSEAEWVEDDEDAEDLRSENDEEDEVDDGEEMAEFLDDENDEAALSRRLVIQGDLEPSSSGLCWEDKHRRSTNVKMIPYRMEIILDHKLKSIDPLSTSYWEEPKAMPPPPRVPLSMMTTNSKNPSLKSFFTLTSDNKSSESSSAALSDMSRPAKMVREEDMAEFLAAIQGSPLAKVGLVDQLAKKFPGNTVKVVTETLVHVAQRGRKKGSLWELREFSGA